MEGGTKEKQAYTARGIAYYETHEFAKAVTDLTKTIELGETAAAPQLPAEEVAATPAKIKPNKTKSKAK